MYILKSWWCCYLLKFCFNHNILYRKFWRCQYNNWIGTVKKAKKHENKSTYNWTIGGGALMETWPPVQYITWRALKFRLGMNVVPHPPNSKGLIYGYTCSRLPSAPRTNALSCLYIVTRKKGFFNWPWETPYYCTGTYNPETAIIFKSVGKVPTFHFFLSFFPINT